MKASIYLSVILSFLISVQYSNAQNEISDLNVYTTVDKTPRLKGAGKDVGQYIRKQIDFNDSYKLRGVEGDIWVSFIVTAHGEVSEVEIEKGIDKEIDAEVVAVVSNTKRWKPGELNRQKVNTKMRLSVRFTLSTSERHMAHQLKVLDEQGKRPLFVLDNKFIDGLVQIENYNVESIRIIKGDKAMKLYGERAENGVVVITSKRGTPPLY